MFNVTGRHYIIQIVLQLCRPLSTSQQNTSYDTKLKKVYTNILLITDRRVTRIVSTIIE